MAKRRLIPLALLTLGVLASFITVGLLTFTRPAQAALPGAGSDTVGMSGAVTAVSRLGTETIQVQGNVTISHGAPHVDAGQDVIDTQIVSMNLVGQSLTGPITVTQSAAFVSHGEVRTVSPSPSDFPASGFFDIFVDIVVPSSGGRTPPPFTVHNEVPFHLIPTANGHETNINAWPANGVEWRADPPTPGPLHCADEGGIPLLPANPAEICVTKVSLTMGPPITPTPTLTPCPTEVCTPTPSAPAPTGTRTPRNTPTTTPTPTPFGPENPTFSVAPGGPSGFHPADLLQIGNGGQPHAIDVSGNDNFAAAFQISSLPFAANENTTNFTTETGEPLDPGSCVSVAPFQKGATAWFKFTAPSTGSISLDTNGSAVDTVLAVYTGSTLAGLTPRACDDDGGEGLQSMIDSLAITGGTVYYVQVGGFDGDDGQVHLNITSPNGAGAGGSVSIAITCSALGLTADGCDDGSDGTQDDLTALSFGADTIPNTNPIAFSVGPGSQGVAGSAVAAQAACSPPEPQADEFTSSRNGTNTIVLDGDGHGSGGCPSTFGFGLIETPSSDNVDALDGHPPSFVDPDGNGQLDQPVYFSLAPGSPSLAAAGESPADILWTIGFSPGIYASAAQLGLQTTDAIDGLCLVDRGTETARYEPDLDTVLFSLAPGSPTLASMGASAADVFAPGPVVIYHASELGLQSSDNLDAMKCFQTSGQSTVKVNVGDSDGPPATYWYCDPAHAGSNVCQTKITAGDTVEWNWVGTAPHTVTACGASCNQPTNSPLFSSGVHTQGGQYQFTFNTPGTYPYYCTVHGAIQMGTIIVNGPPGSTPTPTRTPIPPTPAGVPGDGNCSGHADAIDASLILQLTGGLIHTLPCPQNGDVNSDGRTNAIDAQLILQFVAGLIDHLGTGPPSATTNTLTPTRTPTPMVANASPTSPAPSQTPVGVPVTSIDSCIDGAFTGWTGNSVFVLCNGQVWQQTEFDYLYQYAYRPAVTIYWTGIEYRMQVEGVDRTIAVVRLS